jgi:hypothetical protein
MGRRLSLAIALLTAPVVFAGIAFGKERVTRRPYDKTQSEQTVFITGSLIPQRIKLKRIGTSTVSPIRVIDRREIDQTGRQTTQGVLATDPSVRVIGR